MVNRNKVMAFCALAAGVGGVLSLGAATQTVQLPPLLRADKLGAVYLPNESPVITLPSAGTNLTWTLSDWTRSPIGRGQWPEGESSLRLPPRQKGYYYLDVSSAQEKYRTLTYCVVPDPATRPFPADSFYGTDAAFSWLCGSNSTVVNWYGESSHAATLDLLRLCGLTHVRDRMGWAEVSKEPGKYSWRHYAKNARLAEQKGIKLVGVFHDCAPHAGKATRPSDLKAVYDFSLAYGKMGGGAMSGWEFWNEPDIGFWTDSVWNFMAAMKAGYLGYKAANPSAPVLNGAVCKEMRNRFDELLFKNDLAKFCNVFNFHTYYPMSEYPRCFKSLHDFLERMRFSDVEMWITESSSSIEGEARIESLKPGIRAHSHEQEMAVAEAYAKSSVLMQMGGVSRDYHFAFPPYGEQRGRKDWGVQRRDGSLKPLFTAISAMTEHLAAARIVGEKKVSKDIRCFVFVQPDGSQTAVYWSPSPVDAAKNAKTDAAIRSLERFDRPFALEARDGRYCGSNWCGSPFECRAEGGKLSLRADRYVSYVDGLHGLTVDVPARPRGKVRNYTPRADEDLTVIIRTEFDPSQFSLMNEKTVAELKTGHRAGRVTFQVWNLSDKPKRGRLAHSGVQLSGLPENLSLPPWGKVDVPCEISLPKGTKGEAEAIVWGEFDGKKSSRLVAPIRVMDSYAAACDVVEVKAAETSEYWKMNDSADQKSMGFDEMERTIRFDYNWTNPKTEAWAYPVHLFAGEDRRYSLDGTKMIEFDVKINQDKVENDVDCAYLMVLKSSRYEQGRYVGWKPPTSREWTTVRIDFGSAHSFDGAVGFRLGINPRGRTVSFWIRNLKLFKPQSGTNAASVASVGTKAVLCDPLEWLYDDSRVTDVKPYAATDVPANGVAEANVLVTGLDPRRPVEVSADAPGGEWYRLVPVAVEKNTGLYGAAVYPSALTNLWVTRPAPFRVCDAMEPVRNGRIAVDASTAAFRFRLAGSASAGRQRVRLTVRQGDFKAELPFDVNVHAAKLPAVGAKSYKYTNWINYDSIARCHGLELWSEAHYAMIERYVRLAVRSRQSMAWVPLFLTTDGVPDEARIVRLVETLDRAGIAWICGQHFCGFYRQKWHLSSLAMRGSEWPVTTSYGATELARAAAGLNAILDRHGLKKRWYQHVADEPSPQHVADYRVACAIVRKNLPGVRLFDATETTEIVGILDAYCPKTYVYEASPCSHNGMKTSPTDEMWCYTCCFPGGRSLNRLLDKDPLQSVLLPWGCRLFALDGYLHWGYNQFKPESDPLRRTIGDDVLKAEVLPPGDRNVVYAGKDGPWPSVRLEAMRQGMEDAELWKLLADRNRPLADKLMHRLVRGFSDYETDHAKYRAVRSALLNALDAAK